MKETVKLAWLGALQKTAKPAEDHHALCNSRSGDDRRQDRRPQRRACRADLGASGPLRPSREQVRRDLPRFARDNLIEGKIDSAGARLVLPDGHSAAIGLTSAAW